MFIVPKDHWISPNVSGNKPPPVYDFTLSKIANEKVVLYGGRTAQGPSSELRVATVLGDSVVSMCVCCLIFAIFMLFLFQIFYTLPRMLGESNKNVVQDALINST